MGKNRKNGKHGKHSYVWIDCYYHALNDFQKEWLANSYEEIINDDGRIVGKNRDATANELAQADYFILNDGGFLVEVNTDG